MKAVDAVLMLYVVIVFATLILSGLLALALVFLVCCALLGLVLYRGVL